MTASGTEIGIIDQSLQDILGRLSAAPQTPSIQQIAGKAFAFRRKIASWMEDPPSQDEVSAVLKQVLDMQIDLMRAGISADEENAPAGLPEWA
jgi:hypothetical protein